MGYRFSALAVLVGAAALLGGSLVHPAGALAAANDAAAPAKAAKSSTAKHSAHRRLKPRPPEAKAAVAAGEAESAQARPDAALPTPPAPPRIAQGPDYEKCLAMLGTDPEGARRFAEAWVATGGRAGAVHCLALADVTLGRSAEGAEMLDQLAGQSGAPAAARASVYGQAGQAWLIAENPERALASTTLALSLTPDDPDLLIDRSIAEGTLGRYGETIEDLDQALTLDPGREDALVFRAAAHRQLKQLDLAQADIDRAVAINPENADALLERGLLRQAQGDLDGAREDWRRAAALAPGTATGDLAQQNLDRLKPGAAAPG